MDSSHGNSVQDTNLQLAKTLVGANLISEETIQEMLPKCNQDSLHLGQYLVQSKHLSATDLAKVMQGKQQNAGLSGLNGKDFGDYEIISEIARGGMGIVYKAKQKEIGREIALKILLSGGQADSTQIRRFFREAKATATLQHPGIVPIYQMGKEAGHHFFTMKFIEGTTFNEFIASGEFSLEEKIEKFIFVCKALDYAHQKKIIHRDLKPSNILMDKEQNPYITDFGLAKVMDSKSVLTQTGSALGTPHYMSPEQVEGDKRRIGPGSDIYAMGIILYQILTNRLPFDAKTLGELYEKITNVIPPSPKSISPDVSASLDAVCMKAIEKQISKRYTAAGDLAKDLERALAGEKVTAQSQQLQRQLAHSYQQHRMKFMVAIVLLIAMLGFFTITTIQKYQADQIAAENSKKSLAAIQLCTKAREAMEADNVSMAAEILRKAIKTYPRQFQGYLEMALLQQNFGDKVKAEPYFQKAVKLAPQNTNILTRFAQYYQDTGQHEKALKCLNHYVKVAGTSQAYRKRAKIFQVLGKVDQASQDFQKANSIDDENFRSDLARAREAKPSQAYPLLESILQRSPSYEAALLLRSELYITEKQFDKAMSDILRLVKIQPKGTYILYKSKCLELMGEERNALKTLSLALKKEKSAKNKKLFQVEIARLLVSQGEFLSAYDLYQTIYPETQLVPHLDLLRMIQAAVLTEHYLEAKRWGEYLLSNANGDLGLVGAVNYYLGKSLVLQQRDTEAKIYLIKSSTQEKHDYQNSAKKEIGYIYFRKEQWQSCIESLEPLTDKFFKDAKLFWILGSSFFAQENWEISVRYLSKAIDLEPWKENLYNKRAVAYKKLNKPLLAEQDLTVANQLNPENLGVMVELSEILMDEDMIKNSEKVEFLFAVFGSGARFRFQIYPDLYAEDIEKAGNLWMQQSFNLSLRQTNSVKNDKGNIQKFIEALYSVNASVREFAANQLERMYRDRQVLELITQEQKKNLSKTIQSRLANVYQRVLVQYQEDVIVKFRGFLFRYYFARDPQGLWKIHQEGEIGEDILVNMILDTEESPFVRFFSARVLFDLKTFSAREKIRKKIIPTNNENQAILFAAAYQSKAKMQIPFPQQDEFSSEFVKSLFVRYAPVECKAKLIKAVNSSRYPRVQLYSLKRLCDLGVVKRSQFINFFRHSNPMYQAFALASYWDSSQLKINKNQARNMDKDKNYLVKGIASSDPRVRRVAILRYAQFNWEEARKYLVKSLDEPDLGTRFAIVMLLAQRGEIKPLIPILTSVEESTMIRAAIFFGGRKSIKALSPKESWALFRKISVDKDPRIRLTAMNALRSVELQMKVPILKKYFKSSDRYQRMGSALAIWKDDKLGLKYEKEIRRLMEDEDREVRKVSILGTVFILNYRKNDQKNADQLFRRLQNSPEDYRRSASLSYRNANTKGIYPVATARDFLKPLYWNWEDIYRTYLFDYYQQAQNKKSQAKQGIIWLEKAIQLYPKEELTFAERAILYIVLGQYSSAIKDLKIAIKMNPERDFYRIWLARTYQIMGSTEGIPLLEDLLHKHPWDHKIVDIYIKTLEQMASPDQNLLEYWKKRREYLAEEVK